MKNLKAVFGLMLVVILLAHPGQAWAQSDIPLPSTPLSPISQPNDADTDIPLIIGGSPAADGELPWQVALVVADKPNPKDGQDCAGTLIDPLWVVTAAHCVVSKGATIDPALRNVVMGVVQLSKAPSSGTEGQRIAISKIIVHPDYNSVLLDNDIALIRLAQPAVLGPNVQPIGYVGPADGDLFQEGIESTVSGWGKTEGGASSDILRKVKVPVVSNAACLASMSRVTGNMLCAGDEAGGKDACNGDSGGPLVVDDHAGGKKLAGIVSWGSAQCASPKKYGVYTRVANYQSWIDANLHAPGSFYLPFVARP